MSRITTLCGILSIALRYTIIGEIANILPIIDTFLRLFPNSTKKATNNTYNIPLIAVLIPQYFFIVSKS